MLKIIEIRLNYLKEPMGITEPPQFSWKIESDRRNVVQKNYQIQMSENENFTEVLYNSGNVESGVSAHIIAIEKEKLKSAKKYFVRIRIIDNTGDMSEWSDVTYFVTGLLKESDWQASYISAESPENDKDNSKGTYIRGEFEIHGKVKEAYAYTTALGLYKFYLNGEKVGEDEMAPGWTTYHEHLLYQTYDVTEILKRGKNVLGALVGAGWYKGLMGFIARRNNYGEQTAFLGQIVVRYEDGSEQIIVTDKSYKGTDSPILFSEIYDGEVYDARKEQDGWNKIGFDDKKWNPVNVVPYKYEHLTAQPGTKVKMMDALPVKEVIVTPEGDTVLDFGQNMAGWIEFKVSAQKGDKVELICFEILEPKTGNVHLGNLRKAKQTITYTCKGAQEECYHPNFTFQGFRYAKVNEYPGEVKKENFVAYAVHSDMEETGTFASSNKDLNQLWHNIKWGMKGNFLDVPTDCPQRNERVGWTGDAQIFCGTASYLMNTYTFFKKWLKDVAIDQTPEGGVPHIVPDLISGYEYNDWLLSQGTHSAAAWADVAVIMPWTMYLTFGDKAILEEQYESMKGWIDFMDTHSENGIWNYRLQFGDWVALDAEEGSYFGATPNELTCTAYYAYSTELFVKTAKLLGREEDYKKYSSLYAEILKIFRKTFFDEEGNMTAQTQTAHILALHFRLVEEKHREKTAEQLALLLEKEDGHLVTGFVGTPYFCHALSNNGKIKEAFELLMKEDFPSWLYQVKKGATTVWEHWDGIKPDGSMWSDDMNSFNHYAYGAIGEWMFKVIAGINYDEQEAGYKHSIIAPNIGGGLKTVEGSFESIYGTVASRWEILEDGSIKVRVKIPANTTAEIILRETAELRETDGLHFEEEIGKLVAKTGSGEYTIVYSRNAI